MNKKYDQPLTLHRGEKEIKMDYLNNVWELENNYEKDAEELEKDWKDGKELGFLPGSENSDWYKKEKKHCKFGKRAYDMECYACGDWPKCADEREKELGYKSNLKEDQLALKIKLYFADYFFYGLFILACGIALGLIASQF
jgi:hypothetical protein